MGAYIAVTNHQWCCKQRESNNRQCVFWRKNLHFKALSEGDRFYFYSKEEGADRKVIGYAHFEEFEINTIQEAWGKYKTALGSDSLEEFCDAVAAVYKDEDNMRLGCIVLSNPVWTENGIVLSTVGIPYAKGTVAGKTIDENEDEELSKLINGGSHERS